MPRASTIHDLFDRGTVAALDDGQLLGRFADRRDEVAFSALVARHGPMVLATARAVARNEQDAEDAFQATFLTLARRANAVRGGATLAPWLHRVAYRSAVGARVGAARRRRRDLEAQAFRPRNPPVEADLLATVRAEVERLPAPYRLAVILCDLEGLTYAEAATRLECTEASLRNRLHRARTRLKTSLAKAGFAESSPLLAIPSTVPGPLIRATTALALGRTTAPATVLLIVQTLRKGMLMIQIKLAALIVATSALGSLGAITITQNPGDNPTPQAVPTPSPAPDPAPAPVADGSVIRGRVLDPSGQPVAEARVTLGSGYLYNRDKPTTNSKADGRFEFDLPEKVRKAIPSLKESMLAATAPGFGVGGTPGNDAGAEIEIRLVAEGPPLQGRILDELGKPVAGVKVVTRGITAPQPGSDGLTRLFESGKAKAFWTESSYFTVALAATTGEDGWFSLTGVGAERIAELAVSGPTIASTTIHAMTRGGTAVKLERDTVIGEVFGETILPNRFDLTVKPTRILEGVVRDAESGQPLAEWLIVGSAESFPIKTRTDADGRYRLAGFPLFWHCQVEFTPPSGQPYLHAEVSKSVKLGPETVTLNWSPRRSIFLSGRASDKVTGQPLVGRVETLPYPVEARGKSEQDFERTESAEQPTDDQGRYRIAAPIGKSVLAFRASNGERYRTAQGAERLPFYEPATREIRQAITPIHATAYHILQEVNVEPTAREATMDLQVDPEGTIELTILDPEGNPLGGTEVIGVGDSWGSYQRQESSKVVLMGFTPNGSRQVVVHHEGRKLAGVKIVEASQGPAQTIKLALYGEVRGRIIAPDGTPRTNVHLGAGPHFSKKPKVAPFDHLPSSGVATDAEGRFRVDRLVPGLHYGASVSDRQFGLLGDLFENFTVEPGEVKDLGDVKVENVNPFYRGPK